MRDYEEYLVLEEIKMNELVFTKTTIRDNNSTVDANVSKFIDFYELPGYFNGYNKDLVIKVSQDDNGIRIKSPVNVKQIISGKEVNSVGYHEVFISNFEELKLKLKFIRKVEY